METKRFPLRVLLTVTTGRLLTEGKGPRDNGIGDLYAILGWMTDDSPMTQPPPRFGEECKPWLLRWFPELNRVEAYLVDLDLLLREDQEAAIEKWLDHLNTTWACGLKAEYDVPRIPADDHEKKDAYAELVAMRGTDEGIIIIPEPPKK